MLKTLVHPAAENRRTTRPSNLLKPSSWRSFLLQVAGLTLVFGAMVIGHAWWNTGSLRLVLPYLSGQRLLFEPTRIELGTVPKGAAFVTAEVHVINTASTDIRLVGAQKTCGCITVDSFPLTIPAGGKHRLKLNIGMPKKQVDFHHEVTFFSNDRGYSSVVVSVAGRAL